MAVRSPPVLETERLVLKVFEREDFAAHESILARPEVHGHLGPLLSREDLWRRTVSAVGMWSVVGFGGLMAFRKSDGALVGNVGLFDAKRPLEPDFGGAPEMGWVFAPEVHGQGIAFEASRALLDWADETLSPTPIWAIISPGNDPSYRLADRLGFTIVSDTPYHGEQITVLRRPARD